MKKKIKKVVSKRRYMLIFLSMFILFSLEMMDGYGQENNRTINGMVKGIDEQPVPGASIQIKGKKIGVITDLNGKFTIDAKEGDVLVISSAGFVEQEVPIEGQSIVDVVLLTSVTNLDEVVVVGYGTVKRKDLTGSISSISSSDLDKSIPTTIDQALQGKVAGAVVIQNSGQPGGSNSVRIRGINTINSDAEPLYVIDGVIIAPGSRDAVSGVYVGNRGSGSSSLSSINPSEIETIDVLKDPSAIAIYGAQASNGVIVITTKRGKEGRTRINYEAYYGIQELPKYLSLMNLREYAQILNDKAEVKNYTPDERFANPEYLGEGTNWQKEIFIKAPMQNHILTMSGGDEKTTFLLSGSYFSQDGIALGSNYKRSSLRFNLDHKAFKWLKMGSSMQFAGNKSNINTTVSDLIGSAMTITPDVAVYNTDGTYGGPNSVYTSTYNPNPVANAALNINRYDHNQGWGNFYAEISFLRNFSFRNEVSMNLDYGHIFQFNPTFQSGGVTNNTNTLYEYLNNFFSYTVRSYLTYNSKFFEKLDVNVMAGHEATENRWSSLNGFRSNFPSNDINSMSNGDATTATNGGGKGSSAIESYFGRITFGYLDKYLLTANIRDDGSSNFAAGNKWVVTYSGAFAWRISQEEFLKNSAWISNLKLRAGYGLTNNANIGGYKYGAGISLMSTGLGTSAYVDKIPNAKLKWETTAGSNIGIDLGLLKGRIELTADAYYKNTDNLLLQVPLPEYAGTDGTGALSSPYGNVGSLENKGFELLLTTRNIDNNNFKWTSSFTLSFNKNKVSKLYGESAFLTKTVDNNTKTTSIIVAGQPIDEFYGYIVDGMFNSVSDFENAALPVDSKGDALPVSRTKGVWVGDLKFRDISGPDGTPDGKINSYDQTYLGSPHPKFQFGINNTFSYQGFDLTIFINGNYGNKLLNINRVLYEDPNSDSRNYFQSVTAYAHVSRIDESGAWDDINNVQVSNPGTLIPGISNAGDKNQNSRISSKFIEDGSYMRIKNVVLGYNMPIEWLSRIHLSSMRIYVNVQNLFTFTKYSGYDPEVGSNYYAATGVDFGRYPNQRIWTFGLNLGL
jgi:TonB-dependent starch-binding outer membrane protein SusC